MGDPVYNPKTGRFGCVMMWRFPVSEKKHVLEGYGRSVAQSFVSILADEGRNRDVRTRSVRDGICLAVGAAEDQMDSIHAQIMKCAAELPNFKPMVAGTGLEVQVANLIAFLRSELEAEKLNTAQMIAIDNERDHYRDLAVGVCSELGMTREEVAGDVLHAAVDEVRKLREDQTESARAHIRTVEGVAEKLVKELADANAQIEQAQAQLERERRRPAMTRQEIDALCTLAEFAGVRNIPNLYPIDLIVLSTHHLKAAMAAHDEDTRRIWELKRVHADRTEWGHTIGRALDALPDSVKASLGDMTCVPECIQRLGRSAEDTLMYQAQVEDQKANIGKLQQNVRIWMDAAKDVGNLRQRLNDAQQRADYGRRLYEAERDHCARIVAVLNDAQVLTDLNELPF
jgi:hypothetical protein